MSTPFWKKNKGRKTNKSVTTGDGQAIFSESYTDKTIYERFEQPFRGDPNNWEALDTSETQEDNQTTSPH